MIPKMDEVMKLGQRGTWLKAGKTGDVLWMMDAGGCGYFYNSPLSLIS